jgi:hypothetical protein
VSAFNCSRRGGRVFGPGHERAITVLRYGRDQRVRLARGCGGRPPPGIPDLHPPRRVFCLALAPRHPLSSRRDRHRVGEPDDSFRLSAHHVGTVAAPTWGSTRLHGWFRRPLPHGSGLPARVCVDRASRFRRVRHRKLCPDHSTLSARPRTPVDLTTPEMQHKVLTIEPAPRPPSDQTRPAHLDHRRGPVQPTDRLRCPRWELSHPLRTIT